MKKGKSLLILFPVILVALMSVIFLLSVSAEESEPVVLYEVALQDGSVEYETAELTFNGLLTKYPTAKAIKLGKNAELKVEKVGSSNYNYVYNDLEIDLNGQSMTSNGATIRPSGAKVTIKNGKINQQGTNFAFINGSGVELTIENCEISVIANFVQLRNGTVTVNDSTITSTVSGSNAIFQISYVGATSNLVLDGCTIADVDMYLVSVGRQNDTKAKNITIKDTEFNTSRSVVSFMDQSNATNAPIKFDIKGDTKLSFDTFIKNHATMDNTTFNFTPGVKLSSMPNVTVEKVGYIDGATGYIDNTDATDKETYPVIITDVSLCYTIKLSDGTVKNIYGITTFEELVKEADSGSLITLYANVDLTSQIASAYITNKNLEINLNGFTFTNSGARLRSYGSSSITMYGGKIVDTNAQQFVFAGSSEADKNILWTFDDCEITADGNFVQIRNGTLKFKNSKINVKSGSNLVQFSTEGSHGSLSFDNCMVTLGSASLVSILRSSNTRERIVTVKDTTVTTSGKLLAFGTGAVEKGTITEIKFTGNTNLKYGSLDQKTNKDDQTIVKFGVGVKMSAPPTLDAGSIIFEDAEGIVKTDEATYCYTVSQSVPIIIQPKFSLTLYTDFTLNLCISAMYRDDIISVKMGDNQLSYTLSDGYCFYSITGISPLEVSDKQVIELEYYNYGLPIKKTIEYSITDYIAALLNSGYSVESKEMICRVTDYVAATFAYVGEELSEEVNNILESEKYAEIQNSEWVNVVPDSTANAGNLNSIIESARLVIDSGVKIRFYLKSGIGNGELQVSSKTVNRAYTVSDGMINSKNYFDVEMRAFEYFNGNFEITFGDVFGSYDFKAYANSKTVMEGSESLKELVLAMYNYFREAYEYVIVSEKDFGTPEYKTITFNTKGADITIDPITVKVGNTIPKPDLSEYTYIDSDGTAYKLTLYGWYNGEELWDFDYDIVFDDITLRAKWVFEDSFFEPKENASARAESTDVRMMSFNILSYKYNNQPPVDATRIANVTDTISRYLPDVVALQECDEKWYAGLNSNLSGYKFVNYDTEDQNKVGDYVNYSTIIYNTETLELIEWEQTPLPTSDNVSGRNITVAVFRNKESGKVFVCMSTHWCLSEKDRNANAVETLAKISEWQEKYPTSPIIIGADFNAFESEDSIISMTDNTGLFDTKNADSTGIICNGYHIGNGMRVEDKDVTNPDHWIRGPFSFCLSNMKNKETLDHVFATDAVSSLYFSAIVDSDALNASDHCPIYCDLAWQ